MGNKQFKDPIYGYINIDSDIVAKIIDTPAFQRLKDIRQTSYAPLYPAAYHNRYVHSLGVYHLGKIAFEAIKPQLKNVVDVINSDSNKKSNFFHLFYTPIDIVSDDRKKAIVNGIAEGLIRGINPKQ